MIISRADFEQVDIETEIKNVQVALLVFLSTTSLHLHFCTMSLHEHLDV